MAKPANCISVSDARDLYNQWQSTRETLIHASYAQDPSDFTFSLSEIQEFIDYVKDESAKQGILKPGIRIYFGARQASLTTAATVFLAPTNGTSGTSPNNYNIDAFNWGQSGWPPNNY